MRNQEISEAVGAAGWRLVLGRLRTTVAAGPSEVAPLVAAVLATDPERVALDVRPGSAGCTVVLTVDPPTEVALATAVSDAVTALGLATAPGPGTQLVEVGIDALDIPAVRPFWRAVLGYADDGAALVDPLRAGPAVWFQQMDAPRPQRNRVHLDISVPHDLAAARIEAALAAGGRITYQEDAPAFWVLADPEGNEACITTWQNRD